MNKGFPNKILGFPIGWKDRGTVGGSYKGNDVYTYTACSSCNIKARVGIQNNKSFLFCPKCLCKLVKS